MPPTKIAIVSHVLPPSWSGQAMVLAKLLSHRDPDSYVQISWSSGDGERVAVESLQARRYRTVRIGGAQSQAAVWARRLTLPAAISLRTAQIAAIVRRERCDAIVACTGDLYDLPTAFAASRVARVPFHAYVLDDYVFQWPTRARRNVAKRLAPTILRGSASVIVPNRFLAESILSRYGVESFIVPCPCDTDLYAGPAPTIERGTVVYTGAVYGAQIDSLQRVATAIGSVPVSGAKLVIYTSATDRDFRSAGFSGQIDHRDHLPADEIPTAQRAADVLVLPLSFASGYHDLVRTSSPGKVGEYLAARRPVLVNAPSDSFVASYFREHDCGLVVDSPDPAAVSAAINRLLEDEALRARLAERAWVRANADFDIHNARAALERALAP